MRVMFWRLFVVESLKNYRCGTSMSTKEALEDFFSPPASVRGSTALNREDFRREVLLPAIRLRDASLCSRFMQRLPHVLLRFPKIKKVANDVGEDGKVSKLLLLMPEELAVDGHLTEEDRGWITSNGGEETTHSVTLDYSHYSFNTILKTVLPPQLKEVPNGFETIGHIAHLNLREECLPYKNLIGQVVLDKQSNIRTVVNKTNQIDNTFRFFKMELLAGEDDMIATVKENCCTFSFDFSKVYWNSRLRSEHERLVNELKKDDVVLDVFAGVGPFAIPAARKGCTVHANDLNPHSYEYLCANAKKNGVTKRLTAYNLDGREFIKKIIRNLLQPALALDVKDSDQSVFLSRNVNTHVIMNLPATAVDFLDSFRGIFSCVPFKCRDSLRMPTIYCYCFSKSEEDPEKDAVDMVARNLGIPVLPEGTYSTYNVRKVAPNKTMIKVTFSLPREVAYEETSIVDAGDKDCSAHALPSGVGENEGRVPGLEEEERIDCTLDSDRPSAKKRKLG